MSNLTFTWRAPSTDFGPIRFVASIALGNQYNVIWSEEISFNNFPMSIRGRNDLGFNEKEVSVKVVYL